MTEKIVNTFLVVLSKCTKYLGHRTHLWLERYNLTEFTDLSIFTAEWVHHVQNHLMYSLSSIYFPVTISFKVCVFVHLILYSASHQCLQCKQSEAYCQTLSNHILSAIKRVKAHLPNSISTVRGFIWARVNIMLPHSLGM